MILTNLLRPPYKSSGKGKLEVSETGIIQEVEFDPFWPCQKLVYEILFRIVAAKHLEAKFLMNLFSSPKFIADILFLFKTDRMAELEYLTKIVYTLYKKVSEFKRTSSIKLMFRCKTSKKISEYSSMTVFMESYTKMRNTTVSLTYSISISP